MESGAVNPLQKPDSHYFLAAQGWLELGNHNEAARELEKLSADALAHPDVLEVRWHLCAAANDWRTCVEIGLAIMRADPAREFGWIHYSFGLHELKRTEDAYTHLATVAEKFSGNWHIPYNLACYCAQLGRLEEAQVWLKKAMVLDDEAVPRAAIEDPDLKPLWDSMSHTIWKKE